MTVHFIGAGPGAPDLITVRGGGYSFFETGGRITEVHARTDRMIDAMHEDEDPRADARIRVHAVEKIARVKGIDLPTEATLSECEALVVESLGLRADGLDAAAYLAALSHLVDEAPAAPAPAPRADGLRGRPVPVTPPAASSDVDAIFSSL